MDQKLNEDQYVWYWYANSLGLTFGFRSEQSIREGGGGSKMIRACFRGEDVKLPEKLILQNKGSDRGKEPPHHFVNAGGFIVINENFKQLLESFDIGETKFHPVTLIKIDKKTAYEGTYFILQVMPMKETPIPELSTHFHCHNDPDLPYLGVIQVKAQNDDIIVDPSVLNGPDIWRDPRMMDAIFMSDALLKAIKKAKLLSPVKAIRCKVADLAQYN